MKMKKNIFACLLAVAVIMTSLPVRLGAYSSSGRLLLSDCESGWQYSGNSQISYDFGGTEGNALSIVGSYGVMRGLSLEINPADLSGYDKIEWDLKAASVSDGSDLVPEILDAYKGQINAVLYFSDGTEKSFFYSDMTVTLTGNCWYRFSIDLPESGGRLLSGIRVCMLEDNAFNTELPAARYYFDSLYACKTEPVKPVIEGAQVNREEKTLRIIASVGKSAYESLKAEYPELKFGFTVVNGDLFDGALTAGEYGADYTAGIPAAVLSERMYEHWSDENKLIFTAELPDFSSDAMRDMKVIARAWIAYTDVYGTENYIYSDDGLSGGYEMSWDKISAEAEFKEMSDAVLNDINTAENTEIKTEIDYNGTEGRIPGRPYAVDVKYYDNTGIAIALYDVVEDFSAPVNTDADSSPAIQAALDSAFSQGGGVVYIPEGVYTCKSSIEIPQGVTLRGEWLSPDDAVPASCGTVLSVETGNISENPDAFIKLNVGAGVRNLTVIYPDYAEGVFDRYSPAIAQKLAGTNDSFNVMNVTVLGGSVGFDGSDGWSELHYLKNIYFSCFDAAVKLNNVTDTGRMQNINISPEYLIDNGLYKVSAAAADKIREYAYGNSTGLYIQRSDWEYVYELNISGLKSGIVFDKYIDTEDNNRVRGSNGQFFGVNITDCATAVDCAYTNAIGYAFTDVSISAADGGYGIRFGSEFMAHFEISDMKITGNIANPVYSESRNNGKITITNSVFDLSGSENYDVDIEGGSISLQQCSFLKDGGNIYLSGDIGAASVLGCTFEHGASIKHPSGMQDKIEIDFTPLNLPQAEYTHIYKKYYPTPSSALVYNIADYGAKSGEDSTEALKKALEDAGKTGGTVYVPQGEYYISDYITVPEGVELRGIYDMPTHPVTKGSVLMTEVGKNDENGRAVITLSEGSGISGMSFYYTDQSYTDFIPYSWTVQSGGRSCWAVNCVFINSYNAADFGTNPSDNHYISYISGSPLRRGLFIGNNGSNGWVENVQFNPHYWKRSSVSVKETENMEELNNQINYTLESFIFGYTEAEHVLGTFAYGGASILNFTEQNGKAANGVFIGHGSDGCRTALTADGIDTVVMINSELVSMNYTGDMHHIVMNEGAKGTLALFNTSAWGQPLPSAIEVNGGRLLISQLFYCNISDTANIAVVNGGSLCVAGAMLPVKNPHFIVGTKGTLLSKANLVKISGEAELTDGNKKITAFESNGCVSMLFDWWL